MNTKIALLVCWYGEYPWYFPYFIHTCGYNPTIDFFIISDNTEVIRNKPNNVQIVYHTIEDLKMNFSKQLGFEVNIDKPYKLCDFKPAYGFLFQNIIQGYDFWGHIDLDIVFGDIRNFMTDELLNNYDVISSRHDYTAGYFTLYRNNTDCNCLFMQSKHYKYVFTHSDNFWFDEFGSLTGYKITADAIFNQLKTLDNVFESMTFVVTRAQRNYGLRVFFDFIVIDGLPGKIKWKNGKIYYKDIYEAIFYHLIQFKKECKEKTILSPIPNEFFFTKNQILETLI
ncbi:MAG: hypothetical protein LBN95_06855 [Prevotellaceae bacterium]|jgi:hypothetical protein|nr:hypothetical protein [Prevotellaceae bacterium]